ncbi:MAG: polysulfide reductase NrfD [Deltaproteobacteria bacterium]|nr:polysulfide reductase NrfD [Deltaproteobacteria bacterium]MBI5893197.1 polysulfide reductase NrfD [Deltaproteobacteria bacterium]
MSNLFKVWIGLLALGVLLGLYTTFQIFTIGHGELANTTQLLPWGLQVSTYIYLALTSTGCSFVYCLATLGGVDKLKPIVPRAVLLALLTIIAGFTSLSLEIGRLERLAIEFIVNPNLTSPMWWMGVFYTMYIVVLMIELAAMIFHIEWLMKVGSVAVLITAIAGHSTLGSVFGVLEGRGYGFGALTPIYFLMMAFLGGASLILLVSCLISIFKGSNKEFDEAVTTLRKVFLASVAIAFLATVWRYVVGVWVSDPYYDLFDLGFNKFLKFSLLLGMIVPVLIVVFQKKAGIGLALAPIIVLVVQFIDRNTLIVGIQKIALLQGVWEPRILPYTPAPVEISVVIFVMSIIGIIYSIAEQRGFLEKIKH